MTQKSRDRSRTSSVTDVLTSLQATSLWQERVYKQLHSNPELSFQETKTAALAASKLKELGYEVLEGIGRTGVVGVLGNGEGETVLALANAPGDEAQMHWLGGVLEEHLLDPDPSVAGFIEDKLWRFGRRAASCWMSDHEIAEVEAWVGRLMRDAQGCVRWCHAPSCR